MVVSFNTFNIIIFCCKDTSFIFVTRWLHVVADLSLSKQLFKIYHSHIHVFLIMAITALRLWDVFFLSSRTYRKLGLYFNYSSLKLLGPYFFSNIAIININYCPIVTVYSKNKKFCCWWNHYDFVKC